MAQPFKSLGGFVLLRVGAVDAVHIGGLEHRLRPDFGGAQHGRGVGGEVRISRAAGEQHDAAFGEIFVSRAAREQFANLRHDERGQRARRLALALKGRFQRQAVHEGGEHAHRVAGGAGHAARGHFDAAKDVPAADNDGDLDAEFARLDEVAGNTVDSGLVNAEGLVTGEKLAGDLDDDTPVGRFTHDASAHSFQAERFVRNSCGTSAQPCPAAAATSAAKSDSCFSIPSPRA